MPTNLYHVESFIVGYDVLLEIIFVIITLFLAWYANKIYRISGQEQTKYLSIGFLFIGLSYLLLSIFNFLIIAHLLESLSKVVHLKKILFLNTLGLYLHMFFMTIGFTSITYMTFKIKKIQVFILLSLISIIAILMNKNPLNTFFLISLLFLSLITYHFMKNCKKRKNLKSLTIGLAFLFILLSRLDFLFMARNGIFYTMGHILEAIAYLLILYNFYLVRKK